jgi:hypothetical protein
MNCTRSLIGPSLIEAWTAAIFSEWSGQMSGQLA